MRLLFLLIWTTTPMQAAITYRVQPLRDEPSQVITVDAEAYVAAVVTGEASTIRSQEALKAIAVAARTFAARTKGRHAREGFDFCSTTHCQRAEFARVPGQVARAVARTRGEMLWFEGLPAFAAYSRDCGGRTEEAAAVWPDEGAPYLKFHEDPYCIRHGAGGWDWDGSLPQIAAALRTAGLQSPQRLTGVVVLDRTRSGRARRLELRGTGESVPVSASSFRFALGRAIGWNSLRSERYEATVLGGQVKFHGSGLGHGVGLCQKGADEMGTEGATYREILRFYYPGTTIGVLDGSVRWTKLGGEQMTLLTTQPERDGDLVAVLEAIRGRIEERFRLHLPEGIAVRIYPTLDAFRNATAEPGWVAARSTGSTVDLQPRDLLERRGVLGSTLNHEFLHLAVEKNAASTLPPWFREGLVECLARSNPGGQRSDGVVKDLDLRNREDQHAARSAYAAAEGRVRSLLQTYGEATVTGWVRTGLPAKLLAK